MKKLTPLILLAGILATTIGCNTTAPGYEIQLTLQAAPDSTTVILYHRVDGEDIIIDSATIVNGKATFTGTLPGLPEAYNIRIDGISRPLFFFLENTKMTITAPADSIWKGKVAGSMLNERYADLVKELREVAKEMRPLYKKYQQAEEEGDTVEMARIDSIYYALQDVVTDKEIAFIKQNTDNILGPFQATRTFYNDDDVDELASIVKSFDPGLTESTYVKRLNSYLEKWSKLKIGMTAPDFSQSDSLGNMLSLSDLRGKYILVDFWASWCGPCRAENPNIVAAYRQYHDKGFDILGVSLDTKRDKWLQAIAKDSLTWNHISDLNGWNNAVSNAYGIRSIPYSLLLDPQGKIIGKNLRGKDLHTAIEQALNPL